MLQRICSAALAIRQPLAGARLSIKCGVEPSVGDCATLRKAAIAEIAGEVSSRVVSAPCRTTKMILNPKPNGPQPHSVSTGSIATALRELRMRFRLVVLVAWLWCLCRGAAQRQ